MGTVICQGNITLGAGCTSAGGLLAPASSATVTLDTNTITCRISQIILDKTTTNYLILESSLADNEAIQLNASNPNGGIMINAGFGGIAIESTNVINMTATNASNLITTGTGNVLLQAQQGLTNIDGVSGVNIGTDPTYVTPIVNIGNTSTATAVNLYSGTGGITANTASGGSLILMATGASSNFTLGSTADDQDLTVALTGAYDSSIMLSSTGTGSDAISLNTSAGGINIQSTKDCVIGSSATDSTAIYLNSSGGITESAVGTILVTSINTSATAIQLDTASGGGGISLNAGTEGIILDAYNGGTTTGGITLTAGVGNLNLNAYGGGLIGIGDFNPSQILIGTNTSGSNNITLGNTASTTSLFNRWSASGISIQSQTTPVNLGSTSTTATITDLQTRILMITPTGSDLTVTLDTAANIITTISALEGFPGIEITDSFDFTLINLSTSTGNAVIAMGTGGTAIGNMTVTTPSVGSGSGLLRLVFTNITSGSEAYTVYRIA